MQKVVIGMLRTMVMAACFVLLAHLGAATAQTAKSPLGVPLPAQQSAPAISAQPEPGTTPRAIISAPSATSAPNTAPGGFWNWVFQTQSDLNRRMATAVKNMKGDNPFNAALMLIGIAFAYGVLHAAGPGHGKSVISAYVLTNKETVRRGIALSFLSALFQALSAILFVAIMALILKQTKTQMDQTEATVETVSWGLIAMLGVYLLWRQIAPLLAARRVSAAPAHGDGAKHQQAGHNHDHDHDHHPAHSHAHSHAQAAHADHVHSADCGCGHSHMPAPQDLQGEWSWRRALPLALSVGIRPCSGAILLLIFALSQGMLWAGVLGTFAMAFGTALTVSILAALAVSSRDWAARASGPGSVWAERIQTAAGLLGASLVLIFGVMFFIASLRGPGPL